MKQTASHLPPGQRKPSQATDEAAATKKKRRFRPGTVALREIRKYQKSTQLLVARLPFANLCRELILARVNGQRYYCRKDVFAVLQEASEALILQLMQGANLCAIHDKRVTIFPRDIALACRIMGIDPGH